MARKMSRRTAKKIRSEESVYSRRAQEMLRQIEARICERLVKFANLTEGDAQLIAKDVSDVIGVDFSGELLYFNQSRANLLRNDAILAALNSGPMRGNYTSVAKQFHLTESAIRKIESILRSADLASRQSDLFQVPRQ